jgi:hypothetical protein
MTNIDARALAIGLIRESLKEINLDLDPDSHYQAGWMDVIDPANIDSLWHIGAFRYFRGNISFYGGYSGGVKDHFDIADPDAKTKIQSAALAGLKARPEGWDDGHRN